MSWISILLGRRLATDEQGEQKIGVWAGVPALGLDGLGSSAYGPEAALTILMTIGAAGPRYIGPLTAVLLVLLALLYAAVSAGSGGAFGGRDWQAYPPVYMAMNVAEIDAMGDVPETSTP